ncbi:MAG: DNA repair protein RecN [Candidatus Sumerlaeaceae bacterium]
MLEVLRISNYAIIDQIEVEFNAGLTTITGETGAGKSIMLDALRLILGDRATSDVVRTGAQRASIEAIFRAPNAEVSRWLADTGLSDDDGDSNIIVRREILAVGSSRHFINNRAATLVQLRDLGARLVDLHGQNEHTALVAPASQLRLLDCFGGYTKEIDAFLAAFREYRDIAARLAELTTVNADADRRKSFLEFQVDEIQKAELQPGEDELLDIERKRLQNADKLTQVCGTVCDLLFEGEQIDTPAAAQVTTVAKALAELAQLDPSQEPLAMEANALRFAIEDLCEKVRDYAGTVQANPQRLAVVEDRLDLLRQLKKKYGGTIGAVMATCTSLEQELESIVNRDAEAERVRVEYAASRARVIGAANALSARRATAALDFEKKVQKAMRELELPKAVLHVAITSRLEVETAREKEQDPGALLNLLTASGADNVEFLVSLNAGEETKPMRKVASGGEISRIMLAIKSVVAGKDEVSTLIFDEIDVGISGQAAAKVGEKLTGLAASHQVLCITHLPQIAARGDRHLVVEKKTVQGRTVASITSVEGDNRAAALAQMLSGVEVDETSRKYAEKLLEKSKA